MNKKLIFSVMLVCLLAFGLVLSSCGNRLSGTWEYVRDSGRIYKLEFKGNNVTFKSITKEGEVIDEIKGTYSMKDNTVELSIDGKTETVPISPDRNTITFEGMPFTRKK